MNFEVEGYPSRATRKFINLKLINVYKHFSMKTFDVSYRCLNSLQIQRRTSHLFNEYNFRYFQMPRKIEGGSFS